MYPFLLIYKSIITPEHPKHSNTYAGSRGHIHVHTCTRSQMHTLDDLVFPGVTVSRKEGRKARGGGRKSPLSPRRWCRHAASHDLLSGVVLVSDGEQTSSLKYGRNTVWMDYQLVVLTLAYGCS